MAQQCNTEYPRALEIKLGDYVTPVCILESGHEGKHQTHDTYGSLQWETVCRQNSN